MDLLIEWIKQYYYNMAKMCVCARECECACVQATWHSRKSKEMSQELLTFCWHLRSVAIWEPYDCWQLGMSAQACYTWPHWAWVYQFITGILVQFNCTHFVQGHLIVSQCLWSQPQPLKPSRSRIRHTCFSIEFQMNCWKHQWCFLMC